MEVMKYTTKITLYNSYFDFNNILNAKSLFSIFQDVASIHAEEIGVGFETMLKQNLYWVLSRVKFDIIKMPKINQTVIVETWPQKKGRIDFDRDLKITSEDGEVLIIGTSKWCVIDTVNRTLQRTENVNYIGEYCLDVNYPEKFTKIILPTEEQTEKFTHSVRFSDLDHNKHMNNTNYANLVVNTLENKIFTHFEINYLSECLLNDNIIVSSIVNENGEYIIGKNNDKISFTAFVK